MDRLKISRRRFVRNTTLGIAGFLGFPYIVSSSAFSSNEAILPSNCITLGLIGAGNINTHHREVFLNERDTRIVAVCDPVESRRKVYRDRINQVYGGSVCTDYRDYRELLDSGQVDSQRQLARLSGTPRSTISAYLRLLNLDRDVQSEVLNLEDSDDRLRFLSEARLRPLLKICDRHTQREAILALLTGEFIDL